MNITHSTFRTTQQTDRAKQAWGVLLVLTLALTASLAVASGGGNALSDLNEWIASELGGSVGLTIGLLSFFSGLVTAIATRTLMPLIWGLGIGLITGIVLTVVEGTIGAGLPIF